MPESALYLVVAVAGCGSVGTQILINGYVASYFGPEHRASALGWYLLASHLDVAWNFYTFAVAGLCGALLVACVPPAPGSDQD